MVFNPCSAIDFAIRTEINNYDEPERFLQCEDYPNYEISNYGNIREVNGSNLELKFSDSGDIISTIYSNNNYHTVNISYLVAKAFLKDIRTIYCFVLRHKDSFVCNNYYKNLEWSEYPNIIRLTNVHMMQKNRLE